MLRRNDLPPQRLLAALFFFLLESSRKGRVVMPHDEPERMDRGMINQLSVDHQNTFSRGHATWSATWSVGRSVGHKYFSIANGFCITAPAQPSATVLPCIRPC